MLPRDYIQNARVYAHADGSDWHGPKGTVIKVSYEEMVEQIGAAILDAEIATLDWLLEHAIPMDAAYDWSRNMVIAERERRRAKRNA